MPGRIGSLVLVIVGVLFLLSNLGILKIRDIGSMLGTWWPVILIVVGLLGMFGRRGR